MILQLNILNFVFLRQAPDGGSSTRPPAETSRRPSRNNRDSGDSGGRKRERIRRKKVRKMKRREREPRNSKRNKRRSRMRNMTPTLIRNLIRMALLYGILSAVIGVAPATMCLYPTG